MSGFKFQWYPGHMHKAQKEIKETLLKADLTIEVLDARIPFSSENPLLAALRRQTGDKPCIKVLSKSDLADEEMTRQWQEYLEREHAVKTLAITTQKPEHMRQLIGLCRKVLPPGKSPDAIIKALIVGIPNVGKSTLINVLAGRTIAKTGNEPAVTKRQQMIQLEDNIVLLDTPGMLWPNVENENSGYRLAVTGAIKDTVVEYDHAAYFAAEYLLERYPGALMKRFELDDLPQREHELLEIIGKKRGVIRSGGKVDIDRVCKIFINELRSGTIGRITLETPQMMEQELARLEVLREQKAAKQKERKEKWKKSR